MNKQILKVKVIDVTRLRNAYGPSTNVILICQIENGGLCKYVGVSPPKLSTKKFEEIEAKVKVEKNCIPRIMNIKKL